MNIVCENNLTFDSLFKTDTSAIPMPQLDLRLPKDTENLGI
jgi:hypothetical protein